MFPEAAEELAQALCALPGIGPKGAQRMVLHMLQNDRKAAEIIADSITKTLALIHSCERCRNFSQNPWCEICLDQTRDTKKLCVVARPADVIALENSGGFDGKYYVLMGLLSPIESVDADDLGLAELKKLVLSEGVEEVVIALSTTLEGEATSHFIQTMLQSSDCVVSRIAQGVPQGSDLEFVGNTTIAFALKDRVKCS